MSEKKFDLNDKKREHFDEWIEEQIAIVIEKEKSGKYSEKENRYFEGKADAYKIVENYLHMLLDTD